MKFKTVHSRQLIDNALFSFGMLENQDDTFFGYRIYCAGEGTDGLESYMPLAGEELEDLINALKNLKERKYKQRIKIKTDRRNINLHFKGEKGEKGIKVIAYISGFLSFSCGSIFCSKIKPTELKRLIDNLTRCLPENTQPDS